MSHPAEEINQNNQKLFDGEYDEAIVSLTKTLKKLKLFLSGDAHTKIAMSAELHCGKSHQSCLCDPSSSPLSVQYEYGFFLPPNKDLFLNISTSISDLDGINPRCETDNCLLATKNPSNIMVFKAPMMVNAPKSLDAEVCEELSYIIIYNLALAHQLKAIAMGPFTTPNLRIQCFKQAMVLFGHSQQIIQKREITIGIGRMHSLAILSNLRHLHYEVGLVQNAEMCTQYMISTMMCIIHDKELDTLGCSADGFFDMILSHVSKTTVASAA